ncbi:hypothetical protein FACS189460_0870 [Deltaproteobacteria bacterium]|nr:hypothetical protein FACS189460_0870 [Deltaproteobacteria bacterium]
MTLEELDERSIDYMVACVDFPILREISEEEMIERKREFDEYIASLPEEIQKTVIIIK